MITTESGIITIGDLTFLRDSAHPARFFAYSTAPRLALDAASRPQFSLAKYHSPVIRHRLTVQRPDGSAEQGKFQDFGPGSHHTVVKDPAA